MLLLALGNPPLADIGHKSTCHETHLISLYVILSDKYDNLALSYEGVAQFSGMSDDF